ncbi:family 1 glycosylhydrolase [Streptomyces sp. AS02]|uniref:family 1 glycosylhydrolase n=1 Tax=Streptomyces sp. AS02 TaxID=2938946 RepID=UPI002020C727|nr:family 1 glycosylhydrolase [Streptomyces sp. AS02]MCL8016262.1 family 1 glycosylhydrolase [Streptomyces sp. AS02]
MASPSSSTAPRPPFRDPALALSKLVDDLLDRLTLDERLAMLHQYVPAVPRLGIASFRTGTEALHGVAGLGVATVFPQAVGLGATWDEDLVRAVAEAVSVEVRAFLRHRPTPTGSGTNGLQTWSPVVNLLRDPRWGRNEEGYSEDPLHTARLGTAYCRGLAGDHPDYLRTAPVLKHFLAYNNETDRAVTSSGLRPRVLHEYDLAAFRPTIASGAATGAMAACNLVNGRPCHVSPLLEDELRRWARPTGHGLFVVSDEEAPCNLVELEHHFDDHPTSHAAALKAGIDGFADHREDSATVISRLRQPLESRLRQALESGLRQALESGLIEEEDVNRAVRRQLQLRFRLGEFDPDLDPYAGIGPEMIDSPEHRALALRAATESVVLLKNDGLLPLDPRRVPRIAVIGPHADAVYEDWYSGTLPYQVGIAAGLEDAPCATPAPAAPSPRMTPRPRLGPDADQVLVRRRGFPSGVRFGRRGRHRSAPPGAHRPLRSPRPRRRPGACHRREPRGGRAPASRTAARRRGRGRGRRRARADVAIVVLGNHPMINGRETEDRAGITLPETQEALLRAVAAVRPETALVVYRPLTVAAAPHQVADPEQRTAVDVGVTELDPYGTRHTTIGWPVVPSAFTELLRVLHARYPQLPPIWITENGSAETDTVSADGHVHDADRTAYLADHLTAVADAVAAGVDVRGHYAWSLLDDFEWARGYDQRFRLVHVDYDTLTRTPKDSCHWYRGLIAAHRAGTEEPAR